LGFRKLETGSLANSASLAEVARAKCQHLILWAVAGVIGLFQALPDHIHRHQDVTGHMQILGESQDRRQAQVL
jgi:hypothetical protein